MQVMYPVLIYDNTCHSCSRFAKVVNFLCGGKITIFGHYSNVGILFKKSIFPDNFDNTSMSWFISKNLYGGNRCLLHLIIYFFSRKPGKFAKNIIITDKCNTNCSINRISSILFNGVVLRHK